MILVVDRFEGNWAVIEYGRTVFNMPRELLPKDAKEGDVLSMSVEIDAASSSARRQSIKPLEDRLFKE